MKTKLSRVGKSSLSMILSLMMIFSTMLIGTITTANAADTISNWKMLGKQEGSSSLTWIVADTKFSTDGYAADFVYDTNGNNKQITFTLRATATVSNGTTVAVCGKKDATEIATLSADTEYDLGWNTGGTNSFSKWTTLESIPSNLKMKFTPSKRYVTIHVYPSGNDNIVKITESDSASGGGATIGAAPTEVLNGTNVMFYVQSYNDSNKDKLYLTNGSASNKKDVTVIKMPYGYISVPKSDLELDKSYDYISNNDSWEGKENTGIKTAKGGELFIANNTIDTVSATTAPTTLSSNAIVKSSANSVTLTTTASSGNAAYDAKKLYIQYYVDDVLVDTGNDIEASTSAQTYTLDVSAYKDGEHTLKTVLTDGKVYYIADTDTFTITSVEQAQLVTPEIEVSNGGVITSGGSVTVSVKNTNAYPTDAGVTFELYKDGTKTSQSNATGSFTVTESGSYTVKAVPTGTVNYKE